MHRNCSHQLYQSYRAFSTPGPLDFFTSPGGLLALLYGRVGSKDKPAHFHPTNRNNDDNTEAPIDFHNNNTNNCNKC